MSSSLIYWDLYELTTSSSKLTGVMLRGRIRKYCLEKGRNILVENATDKDNCVRFAIPKDDDPKDIISYVESIVSKIKVKSVKRSVVNPVLSKLKVNLADRYKL